PPDGPRTRRRPRGRHRHRHRRTRADGAGRVLGHRRARALADPDRPAPGLRPEHLPPLTAPGPPGAGDPGRHTPPDTVTARPERLGPTMLHTRECRRPRLRLAGRAR